MSFNRTFHPTVATSEELPIAILRNGAYLWTQEELDAVYQPWINVVAYPRAKRQAELDAESQAMETSPETVSVVETSPEKIVDFSYRGTPYRAIFSDDKYLCKGRVEDSYGNVLFPFTYGKDEISVKIEEDIDGYLENGE